MTDRRDRATDREGLWFGSQSPERAKLGKGVRKRWPKNNGSARAEREGKKTIFTQLVIIVEEQRRRREAATPGAGGVSGVGGN